jgi:hypothetical protein
MKAESTPLIARCPYCQRFLLSAEPSSKAVLVAKCKCKRTLAIGLDKGQLTIAEQSAPELEAVAV